MFMAPNDKVKKVRDEGLRDVVGGTSLGSILNRTAKLILKAQLYCNELGKKDSEM
jgi:hypothetical protein